MKTYCGYNRRDGHVENVQGLKWGRESYILIKHNPNRSVYGRKGVDAGICVVMTAKTLLIGVYTNGIQPGNCNSVMEKLADYLIEHGI